jgi:vancomycin resistance protein YoaR
MAPDAQTAVDARQLGQQEVDLGVWTKKEASVAGKQATVYMGPAEASKSGGIDSVYVFLPDAFINVDLWDLADPQTVLDAIAQLTAPDEAAIPGAAWAAAEAAVRGCPDLLAMYTTKYEGSVVRQTNVKVAAQYAGDTLLKPDQEYDLDQLLGPRTRERGWSVPVGSLTSGTDLQDSILGGAIAQVATTVFNAAFEAGLWIRERHNTSIYIAHYPAGREAAVAAGSKSLRFVNDTAHDIWICGQSDGITTTFRIYGTDDGRKVQSSKGEFYNIIPKTAVTVEDGGYPKGETATVNAGQDGRTLEVRRTVTMPDRTVLHDDVFTSVWEMIPEEIRVGTATK